MKLLKISQYFRKNFKGWITSYAIVSILTLSLGIVFLSNGYPVTIAATLMSMYCLYIVNHLRWNVIIALFLVTFFLLLNAIIHLNQLNITEYLKSFFLTVIMLFIYLTSLKPKSNLREHVNFSLVTKVSSYIIFIALLVQISEHLFFGKTTSWFWLDGISISTADDIKRFKAENLLGFYRPVSLFHEPSYMAAISFVLLIINNQIKADFKVSIILSIIIILSLSTTILAMLFLYVFVSLTKRKIYFYLAAIISVIIVLIKPLYLFKIFRLYEIFMPGTSGYIRIIEPLNEVSNVLMSSPFGIPLGQSQVILNNSFFLIPLYFGVLSPFIIIFWAVIIWNKIKDLTIFANYSLAIFSLLIVSGAIFTIESAFLLLMINYTFMPNKLDSVKYCPLLDHWVSKIRNKVSSLLLRRDGHQYLLI